MILKHYKRPEVQSVLVSEAADKEIGVRFLAGFYGKRPDTLHYPKDVLEFAMKGASSFHASEEIWSQPLDLGPHLKPHEVTELRKGWDLILDIDCKELEYSRIAADLVISALHHHDIENFGVKFSGNHGFHIGVPFSAFPAHINGQPMEELFPEAARRIAAYLKQMIKEPLAEELRRHTLYTL